MIKENLIVIIAITSIWLIGAVGFYIYSGDVQQIFFSVNCFAVVIATTINLISALEQSFSRKRENTFKYIEKWDDSLLTEARKYTRDILHNRNEKTPDKIYEDIDQNPELKKSIVSVFNFWQVVYMAIESHRVDEKLLRRAFADSYNKFYHTFDCWRTRHIKESDKKGFEDLEKLFKRWNR